MSGVRMLHFLKFDGNSFTSTSTVLWHSVSAISVVGSQLKITLFFNLI